MHQLLRRLILAGGLLATTLSLRAQTCRVNAGTSAGGVRSYIEVYEYDFVTEKPTFPGGDYLLLPYINETRVYPEAAYRRGIQGKVTCSFVVNTDGSISHISVLRGVEASLNKEAIRIISSMPAWVPGRLDGQAVPVRVVRSVPFRK